MGYTLEDRAIKPVRYSEAIIILVTPLLYSSLAKTPTLKFLES